MGAYHTVFNVFGDDQLNPNYTPGGNVAVTGTNTYTGATMGALGEMDTASLQISVTSGTPTGSVALQVSNDPRCADYVLAQTTARWVTLQVVPVSAGLVAVPNQTPAADGMVAFTNGMRYLRMVYTNTSGSGTVLFLAYGVST